MLELKHHRRLDITPYVDDDRPCSSHSYTGRIELEGHPRAVNIDHLQWTFSTTFSSLPQVGQSRFFPSIMGFLPAPPRGAIKTKRPSGEALQTRRKAADPSIDRRA
jgi:hypothetical protein